MNNPIAQIIQMARSGGNPQQLIINMLQQQNTPMSQNLLNLIQSGDNASIERIARNICAQKGLDFDKEFTAFRQNFGL